MSYKIPTDSRAKIFYPDVAIVKNDENKKVLVGILEAKIDPGWLKSEWAQKRTELLEKLQDKNTMLSINGHQISVAEKLVRATIVLSGRNHSEHLAHLDGHSPIVLISEKEAHPNTDIGDVNEYVKKAAENNKNDWERLRGVLQKIANRGGSLNS